MLLVSLKNIKHDEFDQFKREDLQTEKHTINDLEFANALYASIKY